MSLLWWLGVVSRPNKNSFWWRNAFAIRRLVDGVRDESFRLEEVDGNAVVGFGSVVAVAVCDWLRRTEVDSTNDDGVRWL